MKPFLGIIPLPLDKEDTLTAVLKSVHAASRSAIISVSLVPRMGFPVGGAVLPGVWLMRNWWVPWVSAKRGTVPHAVAMVPVMRYWTAFP